MEEENQNQTTQEQVSVEQSQPKSSFPKFILVLIAVLVLGLIGGAYYLGVSRNQPKACTQELKQCPDGAYVPRSGPNCEFTPCPPFQPKPTIDLTSEWKTYTSRYGYSLKYPPEWDIKLSSWKEGDSSVFELQEEDEAIIRFVEPNQPPHGGASYGTYIWIKKPVDNPKNLSSREWAEKEFGKEIKMEDFILNGMSATKTTQRVFDSHTQVFIAYKSKIYQISNVPFTVEDSPVSGYSNIYDYDKVFDQILSTFRFD